MFIGNLRRKILENLAHPIIFKLRKEPGIGFFHKNAKAASTFLMLQVNPLIFIVKMKTFKEIYIILFIINITHSDGSLRNKSRCQS